MAITMTVKKGSGSGNFEPGWKQVKANKAAYGSLENGAKYIDVWFEGYPENFNLRMYAKTNKDGEEFAIANLFRFANAGIQEVVDSQSNSDVIVKIDDSAANLVGQEFWIYLYKNEEGYSRVLQRIAPTEFDGSLDTFTESDVNYWKGRAEQYFNEWVKPNIGSSTMEKTDNAPF
jgi:hypothetical protein